MQSVPGGGGEIVSGKFFNGGIYPMKKKVLSIILVSAMAAGVLAGCGSSASTSSSSKSSSASSGSASSSGKDYEDCTIKFDWWGGDTRHEATQNAVKAFEEKYPGIKVDVNFGAWTDWETAKAMEYQSGTNPDVQQTNFDWIGKYDADGSTYLDLNTVSDTIDLTQWTDDELNMCKDSKGGIAGIPVANTGRLFYWNKATWEKAGLDLPKSVDDLLAAGPVFKEKLGDDYYPLVVGSYDRAILMTYYLQKEVGTPIIDENNKLTYSQDQIKQGVDFIQKLEDNHVIPTIEYTDGEGVDSMDKSARFIDGHYAGIFEWDTAAPKYVAALGDAASDFVVGGELDGLQSYSKVSLMFSISAKTEHPHESALLLNYLLNDPDGVKAMGTERGIPNSQTAYDTLNSAGAIDQMSIDAHNAVSDSNPFYWNPLFDDATMKGDSGTAYYDAFVNLSYKKIDTAKAAETLYNAYAAICS